MTEKMEMAINTHEQLKLAGGGVASELALTIVKTVDDNGYYDKPAATEAVDRYVLQEIRSVLSLTADRRYPADSHGHCWCRKDLTDKKEPHNEFCQRARALLSKLEVRP
jgi:hypothetical protein